jgi:hypothetical protein
VIETYPVDLGGVDLLLVKTHVKLVIDVRRDATRQRDAHSYEIDEVRALELKEVPYGEKQEVSKHRGQVIPL